MGTTAAKRVGFLGMGLMGSRMARNLLRKGFAVTVWNRTRARAEGLVGDGAKVANSPADLMGEVDIACTCLATPAAMEEAVDGPQGLFRKARAGQLFIDFSTISINLARSLEGRAGALGVDFVEAPVTGSKNGAEKGTLLLMVGGRPEAVDRCTEVFSAVGEKAIYCGPVGAAAQVKLAGNALIASMLQGLSEGMLLSAKAGVDPAKLLEVVQASGYRSPYFEFKGGALLRRDFSTHFSIDLMHKDLTLFLEAAAEQRVPTPLAAAVREVYALARAAGKGEQDILAVITPFEELVGVQIRPKS
jgi:3-hydroxyisobutyrate dehydrogenase-like beta-hydroxyacid dehydrogenase